MREEKAGKKFLQKLIGASFSISTFLIFMLVSVEFNLFKYHQLLTTPWFWILFFCYGILSSYAIDWISMKFNDYTRWKEMVCYIVFGYLIFLILSPNVYGFIAGTVGAFFSLLFLVAKKKFRYEKRLSGLVFIVPLICLLMVPFDFTKKIGWTEVKAGSFVEVQYDYLNGEHLIPVTGQQDDEVFFKVEHQFEEGKSHGVSVYDKNGDYAGMNSHQRDEYIFSIQFPEEATKYIVVRAIEGRNGQARVEWWEE
ncbi:hypothetical protein [Alkalihalobacillus sp. 1P02AB]|uniref:hypothetical protein n=1 Tax=Alkalihalobacillus sp. 1P02AB TaxID=3132260 RepID=UPI0039A668BB